MVVSLLRKEARDNLKGKWKKAIAMMLIFFITTIAISFIKDLIVAKTPYGLLVNILNIVIIATLNYGLIAAFIKLKRNEKVNVLHFIYFAGRDGDKMWRTIGRLLLRLLFYIIVFVLFIYLVITETISLIYGYGIRLSYFVEIIGFIGITILLCMQMLYYSLNNFVLYDNKDDKTKDILNESKRLMTNHRWDFFRMTLSFAGWFILGILFSVGVILALYFFAKINNILLLYICYIPLIFLLPYIQVTMVCFYDNVLYNNPKPKEDEKTSKAKKKKTKIIKNKNNKKQK